MKTVLAEIQGSLTSDQRALIDDPETPICDRWQDLVQAWRSPIQKPIWEDFTEEFQAAFNGTDFNVCFAITEFLMIRRVFFHRLLELGFGPRHVNEYHLEDIHYWEGRFNDKLATLDAAMDLVPFDPIEGDETDEDDEFPRGIATLIKEPEEVKHTWLN